MDNITDRLNQILNDPESMKQIINTVSALNSDNTDMSFSETPAVIPGEMVQILQNMQKNEKKQDALIQALIPYLKPSHQHRLEQAIKIASMSHLASAALRTNIMQSDKEILRNV